MKNLFTSSTTIFKRVLIITLIVISLFQQNFSQDDCNPSIITVVSDTTSLGPDPCSLNYLYLNIDRVTELPVSSLTGNFRIQRDLIIDKNFTFLNSKIKIDPGVKITIESEKVFTIDGSHLFTCALLWKGILLEYKSQIVTKSNSLIEDAEGAIQVLDQSKVVLNISNTTFNKNRKCIVIDKQNPMSLNLVIIISAFNKNTFMCNGFLKGTTDEITHSGIYLRNAGVGLRNSLSPSFTNLFTGILYGVYQEGSTKSVNLTNCTFNDIRVAGVYSQNTSLTGYFLKFLNCNFGIYLNNINFFNLSKSTFDFDVNSKFDGVGIQLYYFKQNSITEIGQLNTFTVKANYILNGASGIRLGADGIDASLQAYIEGNATIKIQNNRFNALPKYEDDGFPVVPGARFLRGIIMRHTMSPITSKVNILDNVFSLNHTSQAISSFGERNNMNIENNTIVSSSEEFNLAAALGFSFGSSSGIENVFYNNKLLDLYNSILDVGYESNAATGMTFNVFKFGHICENEMQGVFGHSYVFRGDCSNTQFIQNVAIGGALIRVDRGVIGAQILNGNQWYRHPALNHAPQAFCNDPSLARFSPFTVNQTRSTNNLTDPKPYHPNDIDPLTLPPTYIDPWWSYQAEDNYECTKKFSDSETNEIIISTEIDSIEADSLFSYRMRYSLYEYLSHYPQLLDSSELYEPWMDSISENSNIDEFVMIESNINKLFQTPWEVLADTISAHLSTFTTHIVYDSTLAQLEYDSIIYIIDSILTIQDSLNLNYKSSLISLAEELHESLDEIEPNNALEVVIKSYLDIYISSFIADSITDDQLDRLQFISELCIDSYGKYPMAAS